MDRSRKTEESCDMRLTNQKLRFDQSPPSFLAPLTRAPPDPELAAKCLVSENLASWPPSQAGRRREAAAV